MTELMVDTPHGRARVHLHAASEPRAALMLGHGANGVIDAPDLLAVTEAAVAIGFSVARVEQPYLVAGRRSFPPAAQLDPAWLAVAERLTAHELDGLPLVTGGRSAGARVACRTAAGAGAVAVLCLAFPLRMPARKGKTPGPSRLPELDAVRLPTLVIQGERDSFGIPPRGLRREVLLVKGDHSLKSDTGAVAAAVEAWLPTVVPARA